MRQATAIALLALLLCGCSVLSIDFQPRIRPLEEETLEGHGRAKILLVDLSGVLQDESVSFSLGAPPPRVPLLARVREELEKVEEYVKGGASKFILRPLCPPDRMLEQLASVAEHVCPEYHRR